MVVCHGTGWLVWAGMDGTKDTLRRFFDMLEARGRAVPTDNPCQCGRVDLIADVVAEKCGNAIQCVDPFHIVQWALKATDEVRKQARKEPKRGRGRTSQGCCRYPG